MNTTRWLADEDPAEIIGAILGHTTRRDSPTSRKAFRFACNFPAAWLFTEVRTYGAALSSFIFVQGTKGWASLAPVFPFDEVRHLTGKIAKRSFARNFKITDEFALEIDAFAAAIQKNRNVEADGVQGHRDMIILGAIYEAARTHQPVIIKY